jgi:UDP-glucose:(heptosyl)LPS alpha-1,3-glucosyltransferase
MEREYLELAVMMPRFSRYGGAEGFAWRLSEALARRGHRVDFICSRCETDPPAGVTPVVVGRFGGLRFIKVAWFAAAAEVARRKGGYDVVFGLGKTVHQDILRIGGGPLSVFWRLSKLAWPEGLPRTMKMLSRHLSPANWAIHFLDNARMRNSNKIIAVSDLVRDWIIEAYPQLNRDDITVIYNKPDLERFYAVDAQTREAWRREANIAPGTIVMATAATNFVLKGIRPLLHALASLPENHVLHVAGGRNPAKYLRLARSLGVENRVVFWGRVDDMLRFYNRADLFILDTFYDACSNAVLEALACGLRAVSSANNGSARFLPRENLVRDPGDVEELRRVLRKVQAGPAPGPFSWPDDVLSGLEPYVELVERYAAPRKE